MTLDDYIFEQLHDFEDKYDFMKNNKSLTDYVHECRSDLLKLINEEQYKALRQYVNSLYLYAVAEKIKYFKEGFLLGYQTEEELSFEDYE